MLANLVEAGFMTEGQVFGARRSPATAVERRDDVAGAGLLRWDARQARDADMNRDGVPDAPQPTVGEHPDA